MRRRWRELVLLLVVLAATAVFRLTGIDWDGYEHFHPDERYIAWVATTIEWPADWQTAFKPHQTTLNPFYWPAAETTDGIVVPQDMPRKFAYGHVPLYLGVGVTRLTEWAGEWLRPFLPPDWLLTRDIFNGANWNEYRHLTAVGRLLTAITDMATVLMIYLLGRRLFAPAAGLLAASFLAVNVMHIQLSHFFTVDPFMTFFVVTAVYCMACALTTSGKRTGNWLLWASIATGLAVGSKFSAVMLIFPLTLTAVWSQKQHWKQWLTISIFVVAVTFALTNPFAILDLTCEVRTPVTHLGPLTIPSINWGSCYLGNIGTQGAMVRGELDLPFTRQYAGTLPYLYYLEMQFRWGMGPLLALVAFAGLGWAIWHGWRQLGWGGRPAREKVQQWLAGITALQFDRFVPEDGRIQAQLVLLAWVMPYFLITGGFYVKFMRYLQPITPFLALYGAAMLWQWPRSWWRRGVITAVLLTTTLYAISFINIYSTPHPWIAASQWIHTHVPTGSLILSEQWDDPLPVTLTIDNQLYSRQAYRLAELPWLTQVDERDTREALYQNLELLAQADYVVISSNRVYGVIPRLPERYPLSSQYHQLLFDGALGYELVFVTDRAPNLGGFFLQPDTFGWPGLRPPAKVAAYLAARSGVRWGRADESFTVYDQPLTMIFANTGRKTAAEMLASFRVVNSGE